MWNTDGRNFVVVSEDVCPSKLPMKAIYPHTQGFSLHFLNELLRSFTFNARRKKVTKKLTKVVTAHKAGMKNFLPTIFRYTVLHQSSFCRRLDLEKKVSNIGSYTSYFIPCILIIICCRLLKNFNEEEKQLPHSLVFLCSRFGYL